MTNDPEITIKLSDDDKMFLTPTEIETIEEDYNPKDHEPVGTKYPKYTLSTHLWAFFYSLRYWLNTRCPWLYFLLSPLIKAIDYFDDYEPPQGEEDGE